MWSCDLGDKQKERWWVQTSYEHVQLGCWQCIHTHTHTHRYTQTHTPCVIAVCADSETVREFCPFSWSDHLNKDQTHVAPLFILMLQLRVVYQECDRLQVRCSVTAYRWGVVWPPTGEVWVFLGVFPCLPWGFRLVEGQLYGCMWSPLWHACM